MIGHSIADAPELRSCLQALLGGGDEPWRLVGQEELKRRVHRLRFAVDGEERSFVVKRSRPLIAQRNHLVATKWLPAVGLDEHGPGLLALAEQRAGRSVWQVYADLGRHGLEPRRPVRDHVDATVAVIAKLHVRFADHPLLAECELRGADLGMSFYASSVRDGIAALEVLQAEADVSGRLMPVRERLLARLRRLRDEEAERAHAMGMLGVPETLLHGDLWTPNVLLVPDGRGLRVRLIDWDHVGVGPVTYDVSTFLLRFPPAHRPWILDAYRRETKRLAGWRLPADDELDRLFETAEFARLSSLVPESAATARAADADWAVEQLEAIEAWFQAYRPVLCC